MSSDVEWIPEKAKKKRGVRCKSITLRHYRAAHVEEIIYREIGVNPSEDYLASVIR